MYKTATMTEQQVPEIRDIATGGGNYCERVERHHIVAETVNIYEGITAKPTDTIANNEKAVEIKQLAFAIAGSINEVDQVKLKAIVALLQKLSGDASIEIIRIEEGSIRLILNGSASGLEKIKELFESGELIEVLGETVEYVRFVEDGKSNLDSHGESASLSLMRKLLKDLSDGVDSTSSHLAKYYTSIKNSRSSIFVVNLSDLVTSEDLIIIFSQYGTVVKVTLPTEQEIGRIRGAFVEMATEEEAYAAVKGLNGADLKGCSLIVQKVRHRRNLSHDYSDIKG
jgi:hypothetical protein